MGGWLDSTSGTVDRSSNAPVAPAHAPPASGGGFELGSSVEAVAVALAAAFILTWLNLAVGIIGSEDNPANLMYAGVLAIAAIGALLARFRARGMERALVATAVAQALVAVIALLAGFGYTFILTGFFVALWLTSAQLFRKAAREQAPGPVA